MPIHIHLYMRTHANLYLRTGPLNFVLYKMMYTSFDVDHAFFVAQCVNLQYVIYGGIALKYYTLKGEITANMYTIPHIKFIIMGLLDSTAGMLAGLSSKRTSGASQQLLNQALIPCTMLTSYLFLGRKSTATQIIGAVLIFVGASIVIMPSFFTINGGADSDVTSISNPPIAMIVYFCSNIPYSLSYVYKEHGFKNLSIHVIYLTQWVSIYQLAIGFLLAPLQFLPGVSTDDGLTLHETLSSFNDGFQCFIGNKIECNERNTFLLCVGYCIVNFFFNTLGLFLVKHGSATFNSISYAIILPLTTLAFSLPFLGSYSEPFQMASLLGLVVVLSGFFMWKFNSFCRDDSIIAAATASSVGDRSKYEVIVEEGFEATDGASLAMVDRVSHIESFQERVIGGVLVK